MLNPHAIMLLLKQETIINTRSILSNVTIQISSEPVLTMPKSLGKQLGVRKGERVSVQVRNGTLRIRKNGQRKLSLRARSSKKPHTCRVASMMDWAGIIKSKSGKVIDFEEMTNHHGYEQLEGKAWAQEFLKSSTQTKRSDG